MNISSIFGQMLILFLTIGVGYLAAKARLVEGSFSKGLSSIVVNFSCPALILHSVLATERVLTNAEVYKLTLLALLSYVLLFAAALVLPRLLRVPAPKRNVYRFLILFNNVGFMGFPVAEAIFGPDAVFFVAIFQIPFTALCFTYGTWLISDGRAGFSPRTFFSPILICTLLAYVLYLTGFQAPAFLVKLTDFVGSITSPAAMILVGAALAKVRLKEVFTDLRLYLLCLAKLIVLPLIGWVVLRLFVHNALMLGILVVMLAMPAATNATILAAQYDGDSDECAKGVFLTTLLSVGTIPLLMAICFG